MRHNLKLKDDLAFEEFDSLYKESVVEVQDYSLGRGSSLFLILLLLLVADGVLTYIGISHSGTRYEANRLVRAAMELFGIGSGILLSKSIAIISLFILWYFKNELVWIFSAVKALIFVYLSFAIIPWAYVLGNYLFPLV